MIKNILWRADGALFDTHPAITYAMSRSLNELGLSVALNVIDGLARQSLSHCLRSLSIRYSVDADLLRRLFDKHYRSIPLENQPPFPGVADVCAWIRARNGVNIAISQQKPADIRNLLTAFHLHPYFTAVVGPDQDTSHKPDAALFLEALHAYDLEPADTFILVRREAVFHAKRATDLKSCHSAPGFRSDAKVLAFDNYTQFLDLLKGSNG